MTRFTRHLQGNRVVGDVTALAGGAATMEIDVGVEAPGTGNHCAYAVELYDAVAGGSGDVVAATAGTATFTYTEFVLPSEDKIPDAQGSLLSTGVFPDLSVANHSVDFNAPGHVLTVKVVLAGITGDPTHARVRFAGSPA